MGRLAAIALPMALSGCPALLSDDFRIVPSDGGPGTSADVRDAAMDVDAVADALRLDVGAEVTSDTTIDSADSVADVASEDSTIDSDGIVDASSAEAVGNSADAPVQCAIGNHCADGLRDCDETGVDCGGVDCAPCQAGAVEAGVEAASDAAPDVAIGCAPGTRACNRNILIVCNSSGQWQEVTVCPNICSSGACI